MKYFLLTMFFVSFVFAAPDGKKKTEEKLKEVDVQINAVDYPFKPETKALIKYLEELELRIEALEKKPVEP